MLLRPAVLVAYLGLLAACRGGDAPTHAEPPPESQPAAKAEVAPAPAAPKAAALSPKLVSASYRLELSPPGAVKAGEGAEVTLSLAALGEYHVNQDYPLAISVTAGEGSALKPTKASFDKAAAAEFGEKAATFKLPFEAPSGTHQLVADVDFAVCTESTCVPEQQKLAVAVTVK